ncbi:MAG: hypothetical protein WAZ31_03575 [Rectinemataceae bacterium]
MAEVAGLAALLSLPVLLLLFLRSRRNRRIEFPHFPFTAQAGGQGSSRFSHFIHTRLDLVIDEACAIGIAFALVAYLPGAGDGPGARREQAVVIDMSRSMTLGSFGDRPLDRAVHSVFADAGLKNASTFALGFDASSGGTVLVPADGYFRGSEQGAAMALSSRFDAFSVDYSLLERLPLQGFTEVVLLTDGRPSSVDGLRIVDLSSAAQAVSAANHLPEQGGAYPTAAGWDPVSQRYRITIAERGPKGAFSVSSWEGGMAVPLGPGAWAVLDVPGGVTILVGKPGVYIVKFEFDAGPPAEFAVLVADRKIRARAEGDFSSVALSVFPDIDGSASPAVLLADASAAESDSRNAGTPVRPKNGTPVRRFVTDPDAAESELLFDPGFLRGKLVAAGTQAARSASGPAAVPGSYAAAVTASLSPASLASRDLVFLYDGLLASSRGAPYSHSIPEKSGKIARAGEALVAVATGVAGGFVAGNAGNEVSTPLVADPSEYFPEARRADIAIPGVEAPRTRTTALLATLFAVKLLHAWLSGRRR